MLLLAGCGFRLREAPKFDFASLRIAGLEGNPVAAELRRELRLNGLRAVNGADPVPPPVDGVPAPGPEVVLTVLIDQRERAAVGQTAAGQIRELQLRTRFRFRLRSADGRDLIEDTEILIERELSFNETVVLSKAAEEERLFLDMTSDIVQQVVRRLVTVKAR
ncbi:LPS assembly lipoprotein LptE [uncultured Hydrogenophaga sp.]|uniref:LPS-assembly lipoprotein LptE n=1 Tax=uncultured Hydrogenophaga sp. TaxID=199683 RepID=UPI00374A2004